MKLLHWNIQHGGGTRDVRIVSAIAGHNPDIVVLTEYRAKPGMALCQAFAANGWPHIVSSSPAGIDNGICVLSRTPLRSDRTPAAPPENLVRWLDVDLPEKGFGFSAIHILTAIPGAKEPEGAAKTRFWDALLLAAEARIAEPLLLVGDFNTGTPRVDEAGCTFVCADHFARLAALGWIDVWRHFHGGATEYTWYSNPRRDAAANGYRIDHAFASPSLLPRITACRYSHAEREQKVSDHSSMIVEFR
jgi:exodeoxyribonuclease III